MDLDDEYVPDNYPNNNINTNPNNSRNYDSMSEEEEYQPIDYSKYQRKPKKASYKRAQRSFVANDEDEIEYQRPLKKRKKMIPQKRKQQAPNMQFEGISAEQDSSMHGITSTTIINSLKKKNQNYDKRATTKILSAKEKNEKNGVSAKIKALNHKKKRKRKGKGGIDSFSTTLLIAQKTTQNSMHSGVPLTVQEKYLTSQYKAIEKVLEKQKKVYSDILISSFPLSLNPM